MGMNSTVFILGGMQKQNSDGTWRTSFFNEGDNFGATGDYLRPKAAAILYKKNPSLQLFVVGGKGQLKDVPDAPSIAGIMKNELIELGVPQEAIKEETGSGNSHSQLIACAKLAKDHDPKNISILSNEYHLPRLRAKIAHSNELKTLASAEFISAEATLIDHDPDAWKAIINTAYKSQSMKARIALEQKGVKDIEEGRYSYNGGHK